MKTVTLRHKGGLHHCRGSRTGWNTGGEMATSSRGPFVVSQVLPNPEVLT